MPIMMPAAAPGIKATKIDFRKSLLDVAFTDHLIAHDSRYRRLIAILGRQQRECGFGK
jgi:hypothetical protein